MSHPQIAIFARLANGNAAPVRAVAGQKALLARTTHGIAYDEVRDVFMIPNFYAHAIQVFRGDANGDVPPLRIIQGPKTQIKTPDKLMFDSVNNEIYVPQGNKLLVFDGSAQGDVAPRRILGPAQDLAATLVGIDPVHNLLVVAGNTGRAGGRFAIFDRTAAGDAKPKWVIQGPHADIRRLMGPIALVPHRGLIVAGIRTNEELGGDDNFVGVWDLFAKGDTPPLYRIGGPSVLLQQVRGVTLDPKHKELIVTDKRINAVLTYYFPEIF
ncbi:MAG: hypothetical protein A3J28_11745 [Acidobacteria bacterium RIFCSPLOWO2_12_FULL_60_22]|nr:MAG: hypothetical protein A3J28_11745 [Acidobacteria bacterium RIFCSPLOWO2_12_FULL_60_22]